MAEEQHLSLTAAVCAEYVDIFVTNLQDMSAMSFDRLQTADNWFTSILLTFHLKNLQDVSANMTSLNNQIRSHDI